MRDLLEKTIAGLGKTPREKGVDKVYIIPNAHAGQTNKHMKGAT